MNPYGSLPLETLTEALALAQAALPKLARGELVGSITTGDKRISFVATTTAALQNDIAYLQAAIAVLNGTTARKGFYLGGGIRAVNLVAGIKKLWATTATPTRPAPPKRPLPMGRAALNTAYESDSLSQRVADWDQSSYGPNAALDSSQTSRARSQNAIRNNPWMRRAVKLLVSHLIGCGIQPRPKLDDKALRADILTLWNDWTAEADYDGVLGFCALQSQVTRARYESGEVFCRLQWRPKSAGLSVPLQIQLLEADLLPLGHNQATPSIRQGIERSNGQRVAYWFYREHPGNRWIVPSVGTLSRVPAAEILHHYLPDRPSQLRGAPEGISTLYRARSVCGTHGHDLISSAVEPVGWWSRLTRPSGQYDPVVGVGHGDAGRALA